MTLGTYTVAQMLSWLALLGILSYSWWSNRHALALVRSEARLLTQTVATLSQQLGLIHQAVIPLNLAIQQVLVKELTHYHTPVLDALMAKLGCHSSAYDRRRARPAALDSPSGNKIWGN